ncbi:uncharacterized protein LOC124171535 [Ischnura elegans]|uniref:uncharacterized protein LOC124171535 n=1 Tax=Ischnura elegans TaxID=197161 RepID=UPI001ED899DB|nr:uncharacterized protein LOC124171535 [Ischnura elegans]
MFPEKMDSGEEDRSPGSGDENEPKFSGSSDSNCSKMSERSMENIEKSTLEVTSQEWDKPSTSKQADMEEKIGLSISEGQTSQTSAQPSTSQQAEAEERREVADWQPPKMKTNGKYPFEFYFMYAWTRREKNAFCKGAIVKSEIFDRNEQEVLLAEIGDIMEQSPLIEEENDFLTAKHRVAEKKDWPEDIMKVIQDIIQRALGEYKLVDPTMTVLGLDSSAYVMPHSECKRCQGDILIYINLYGTVALRLLSKADATKIVDIYMTARSILILKKEVQKGYIRQILKDTNKRFKNVMYTKTIHFALIIADKDQNESGIVRRRRRRRRRKRRRRRH